MKTHKIVAALGGNALEEKGQAPTAENQYKTIGKAAEILAELSLDGHEIAIVHGNGPQVGRIAQAWELAALSLPVMPFDVCGAMSQGYIGYHIQQAMKKALRKRGLERIPVVSLITQVLVDEEDPAFRHPQKPIGSFYTQEQARKLEAEKGYSMKEDAGRGYRRVVPSPRPREIIEFETLKRLWKSTIVILCGGGGIPVIQREDGNLEGVEAVIDKDLAASLTARSIDADILMILTEVDYAAVGFGTPEQKNLEKITTEEAGKYMEAGEFAPGSMLPKMQAAVEFAASDPERMAVITSLKKGAEALKNGSGTWIRRSWDVDPWKE